MDLDNGHDPLATGITYGLMTAVLICQIVFFILKLTGVFTFSWWFVFMPFIAVAILILGIGIGFIIASKLDKHINKN